MIWKLLHFNYYTFGIIIFIFAFFFFFILKFILLSNNVKFY